MRPIDADKLREDYSNPELFNITPVIFKILDRQPTIEAKPVQYGEWIPCEESPSECKHCSNCKEHFYTYGYDENDWTAQFHYCPNCGVKMGGGD